MKKLNLGSGRIVIEGYTNIDVTQIFSHDGRPLVDHVLDLEKDILPFEDNSVSEIVASNFLEHISNLKFVMNECWRVLSSDGVLIATVPICGTKSHWQDPTHKRCFIPEMLGYFVGSAEWNKDKPSHPRYADYGFMPWKHAKELSCNGDMMEFYLTPRK